MKKKLCLLVAIFLLMFNLNSPTVYAKANLNVLKNSNGWLQMSRQDQEDTIRELVNVVSKDLELKKIPEVSFFEWPEYNDLAYNTMWTNTICVNMSHFLNTEDSDYAGVTIEYHLTRAIAHEVRHSYQFQHEHDDTDYGRACYNNIEVSYASYENAGYEAYRANFVEQDAEAYGVAFADKYVKNGKLKSYTANNGKKFDPVFYANTYPDVKAAFGTDPEKLLKHYNEFGIYENRLANKKDMIFIIE